MAAVLYRAVTGASPPDTRVRHRSDPVGQKLGYARVRYSGAFVSAIEWGLELLEARRPQTVDEWRGAILRNKPAGADAPRIVGTSELTDAEGGKAVKRSNRARAIGVAVGILLFFVFMQTVEVYRQRAAQQQALSAAPAPQSAIGNASQAIELDFRRADADASGELTRGEVAAHLPQFAPHFDEIDADRDGRVTTSELQAYWEQRER